MKPLAIEVRSSRRWVLATLILAGTSVLGAQQSPASSAAPPATQAAQSAQTPAAMAPPKDDGPQSFTVQPTDAGDEEQGFVLHAITRRVVVDVVVTGPEGKPVPGLAQQDFTVLEDRKPQSIHEFEVHTPETDRSTLPPAPSDLPSHTFVNLETTPASGPLVVVLLDFLNTPIADQMVAHVQILRFLETKPASLEVAIFALGDRLSLVRGFTTDTGQLLSDMRSKESSVRLTAANDPLQRAQTTLDAFAQIGAFLAGVHGRKNLLWFSGSFEMLLLPQARDVDTGALIANSGEGSPGAGLQPITGTPMSVAAAPGLGIGNTSLMPGTGNGSGSLTALSDRLARVATALAVSQTAVYPIDVRGLMTEPGYSAALTDPSSMMATPAGAQSAPPPPHSNVTGPAQPAASTQSHLDFVQSLTDSHATMEQIADATGGRAFENTNGIAAAADQAIGDGASYYTLVYAPSNLNFDGGLRTIHVVLDKPGCKLAYRSAYYAVDPATVAPGAAESDSLAAAMQHGAPQAQGLIFKAQIDPEGAPAVAPADSPLAVKPAAQSARKLKRELGLLSGTAQSYSVRLGILARQLEFTQSVDGRHHAALEIACYAYAADGRKLGGTVQKLRASMPPLVYAHALEEGMFHSLHVQLPVEAASLRLAILDRRNGRAGSLEVALPLPAAQQAGASTPSAASPKN